MGFVGNTWSEIYLPVSFFSVLDVDKLAHHLSHDVELVGYVDWFMRKLPTITNDSPLNIFDSFAYIWIPKGSNRSSEWVRMYISYSSSNKHSQKFIRVQYPYRKWQYWLIVIAYFIRLYRGIYFRIRFMLRCTNTQ